MSRIFIFGNIVKDVYLDLEDSEPFELDEKNTPWLDLSFNGSKHFFDSRTPIYSGAMLLKEIFENFDISAEIAGSSPTPPYANEYRYILTTSDKTTYFASRSSRPTHFLLPPEDTEIIFVDRTAHLSDSFVSSLLSFKSSHKNILLVYHSISPSTPAERLLASEADLLFTNTPFPSRTKSLTCLLSDSRISVGNFSQSFTAERTDLMTDLTLHSIAAATLLSAILCGKKTPEALLYAKLNLEHSRLNSTLDYQSLSELVSEEKSTRLDLREMARFLVSNGKGILAADESGGSIHKKFESMNIPDDESHRRDYRNLFFTTPDLEKYVNGVILFEETANQFSDDGRNFVDYLTSKGIVPGIKVDQGLKPLDRTEETYTSGFDGLPARLASYYKKGLRFAKWRAAFNISDSTPTDHAIEENCRILADYALACQSAHIVPIVEPEVVYDGYYSLGKSAEITKRVLESLFSALEKNSVDLAGTILKVNMVLAGKKFEIHSTPEEVGAATAEVLRSSVPASLAGVVFLSGGQTVTEATDNLRAVIANGPFPWPVTFSFARALQEPALLAWGGVTSPENIERAHSAFAERLVANCDALKEKTL